MGNNKTNCSNKGEQMKKVIITIVAVLILVGSIFAFNIEHLTEKFELTDAQAEKIEKITDESERNAIDKRAELEKAQLDMKKIMSDEKSSRSDIIASTEKMMKLQNELKISRINTMLDIRDQLPEEKRADFMKIMHRHKGGNDKRQMMMKSGKEDCGMHGDSKGKSASGCGSHTDSKGKSAIGCGSHGK